MCQKASWERLESIFQEELEENQRKIYEACLEELGWKLAVRDDNRVARALLDREDIHGTYGVHLPGALDGVYHFMKEIGFLDLILAARPKASIRAMVPIARYILIYLFKGMCDVESANALPPLLFSNEYAMKLVGFNAHQIQNGICRRGEHSRKKKKRGPVCPQTVANNLVKFSAAELSDLYNQGIQRIARARVLPRRIQGILDASDLETTRNFKGCGMVTRKEKKVDKRGKIKEIEVKKYGFKFLALYCPEIGIPLAVKVVKIHEHESNFTRAMVEQALKNIEGYAKLTSLTMDRGFLDGEDLWWLRKEKKIHFVIPARKNMLVHHDARSLARHGEGVYPQQRVEEKTVGRGKNKRTVVVKTEIVGVPKLRSFDTYGPPGQAKHANEKNFKNKAINAVVVKTWENKVHQFDKQKVLLTDLNVDCPFTAFDRYDDRSLIENLLNREGKQNWSLKRPPKKSERGMQAHVLMTLLAMSLLRAYRKWNEKEEKKAQRAPLGIVRWRRELLAANLNKEAVFIDGSYGIFWMAEVMMIIGFSVLEKPPGVESREDVLRKYSLIPP